MFLRQILLRQYICYRSALPHFIYFLILLLSLACQYQAILQHFQLSVNSFWIISSSITFGLLYNRSNYSFHHCFSAAGFVHTFPVLSLMILTCSDCLDVIFRTPSHTVLVLFVLLHPVLRSIHNDPIKCSLSYLALCTAQIIVMFGHEFTFHPHIGAFLQ